MGYTHTVQKWNGKIFVQFESSSTSYYSMGAYMPGDDDIDEADVDTLGKPVFADYVCEGKIYRRGNKGFFRPTEA